VAPSCSNKLSHTLLASVPEELLEESDCDIAPINQTDPEFEPVSGALSPNNSSDDSTTNNNTNNNGKRMYSKEPQMVAKKGKLVPAFPHIDSK
jgi:hypothetical protein